MIKLGQRKRCYPPADVDMVYPENESGYVFRIKQEDQIKVTQINTNTQSSEAAPQSFPPAGCDGGSTEKSISSNENSDIKSQSSGVANKQVSSGAALQSFPPAGRDGSGSVNSLPGSENSVIKTQSSEATNKSQSSGVAPQSCPPAGCDGGDSNNSVQNTTERAKNNKSVDEFTRSEVVPEKASNGVLGPMSQSEIKKEVQERTVKIICKTSCKPGLVLQGIKTFVSLDRVEAIGTHGRNTEFYVTFLSKIDAAILLSNELHINGSQAFTESTGKEEVVVRVHWLPYWCDDNSLKEVMGKFGRVKRVEHEKIDVSDDEVAHIISNVRRVTLICQGEQKRYIPHILKYEGKDILLTVRGRSSFCLKCKFTGHIRSSCQTPYCKSCKVYGHKSEDCTVKQSYASRLKVNTDTPVTTSEDHDDPQEDCIQSSLGDSHPSVNKQVPETQSKQSTGFSNPSLGTDTSEKPQSIVEVETTYSSHSTPPPKRKRKHKATNSGSTKSKTEEMEGVEITSVDSPSSGFDIEQFDWVDQSLDGEPPDSVKSAHTPGTQATGDNT